MEFVGRNTERASLGVRVRAALDGAGQVVLLAGEPGVGKTRLAEEVTAAARDLGFRCCWGRATDDEGSPPYWPFEQVLRALGATMPAPTDGQDAAERRFRLFQAVTDLLVDEATTTGLLVVLDDLQWADAASLRLLTHLARRAGAARGHGRRLPRRHPAARSGGHPCPPGVRRERRPGRPPLRP